MTQKKYLVSDKSAKGAAARSTKASAKLEGRVVVQKSAVTGRFLTQYPARKNPTTTISRSSVRSNGE